MNEKDERIKELEKVIANALYWLGEDVSDIDSGDHKVIVKTLAQALRKSYTVASDHK